jgi:hypothetical protein
LKRLYPIADREYEAFDSEYLKANKEEFVLLTNELLNRSSTQATGTQGTITSAVAHGDNYNHESVSAGEDNAGQIIMALLSFKKLQAEYPDYKGGFATLFMNRTNRSGILKAGVIGGKNQAGVYKLDARFKKEVIAQRIAAIAERAADITVYNEDSLLLLKRCKAFLPKASLIYLDPPYYVKGKGLYRNYYEHDDHLAIAKTLKAKSFNRNWVVSYDNTVEIREMYELVNAKTYGLNYTAQRRYMGNEIMFFSSEIVVPDELSRVFCDAA